MGVWWAVSGGHQSVYHIEGLGRSGQSSGQVSGEKQRDGALYLLRHVLRITHVHRGQPCAHDPRAGPKAMLSGSTTAPRSCHLEFSGTLARHSLSVHLPSGTDQDFRICDSFADMWMCCSAEWTQITVGAEPSGICSVAAGSQRWPSDRHFREPGTGPCELRCFTGLGWWGQ